MASMAMSTTVSLMLPPLSPSCPHQLRYHILDNGSDKLINGSKICLFADVGFSYKSTKSIPNCAIATSVVLTGDRTRKHSKELQTHDGFSAIGAELGTLRTDDLLREALGALDIMDRQGMKVGFNTYASLLQACANTKALVEGKQLHARIIINGMEQQTYLGTELVSMYAKCGSLACARQVFDKIPKRNIFSWTAMIGGYVSEDHWEEVLLLYRQMQEEGLQPDHFIYPKVLKACANLAALQQGKEIHVHIIRSGFELNVYVVNALVDMYVKCGSVDDAQQLFDRMSERDAISWNVMISGYSQTGRGDEALKLFQQMQLAGVEPDQITWNAMISGYAQSGHGDKALNLFYQMQQSAGVQPNVISWTAIVAGYAQNGHDEEALELFRQMQLIGVKPNSVTIASILSACAHLAVLQQGKEIHGYTVKSGFESYVLVGNALVDMYAKCGIIEDARERFDQMLHRDVVTWNAMIAGYAQRGLGDEAIELFLKMKLEGINPDVITWNGMIAGYAQNGHADKALKLFHQMQLADTKSDSVTISSILSACARLIALQQGREIHDYIIKSGFELHAAVASALVAMYAGCGNVEDAREVFDNMSQRDVISWNAMIAGYAQNGYGDHALKLLRDMQIAGIVPNSVTIVSVLPACALLAALQQGKEMHTYIIRSEFDMGVFVWNALIDMYAKCGSLVYARRVFDKMSQRDVVSWNAMIAGYGMHGHGKDAIRIFCQMQQAGMKPNHVTFTCVLSACSHSGLVDEGWQYFDLMSQDYGVIPSVEQYACMVDLLGRAGHLDEAQDFINKMPIEPNVSLWGALLGACKVHCNIELAQDAADHLFVLEPENAGNYVLLSNIYAAADRGDDAANVRKLMKDRGLKKPPGCSWIDVNNKVHLFHVGDRSHPQMGEIYATLKNLAGQIKMAGYVPDTNLVLRDIREEEKEYILCGHSEKLAIVFGLLNICPGIPIRIFKNLRMCCDCHTATKFISKIAAREIIVRDVNRFHYFKDGLCSCGDYW